MNKNIMKLPPCKPGYWYVNTAPLGHAPKWEQQVAPMPENDKLFGYEKTEFLAKQYRGNK